MRFLVYAMYYTVEMLMILTAWEYLLQVQLKEPVVTPEK